MKTILGKSALPLVIAGALLLAGCGGSDAPTAPPAPPPPTMEQVTEMTLAAINGSHDG